jgi:hypothetical protein
MSRSASSSQGTKRRQLIVEHFTLPPDVVREHADTFIELYEITNGSWQRRNKSASFPRVGESGRYRTKKKEKKGKKRFYALQKAIGFVSL